MSDEHEMSDAEAAEFIQFLNDKLHLRLAIMTTLNPNLVLSKSDLNAIAADLSAEIIMQFPPEPGYEQSFAEQIREIYAAMIDELANTMRRNGARVVRNPRPDQRYNPTKH